MFFFFSAQSEHFGNAILWHHMVCKACGFRSISRNYQGSAHILDKLVPQPRSKSFCVQRKLLFRLESFDHFALI